MKQSVISLFDYPPKPTKELRLSPKFKGAHLVNGRKGHFFLDDVEFRDDVACVQYVFNDGKWRQDTYYFPIDEYKGLISLRDRGQTHNGSLHHNRQERTPETY